MTGRNQDAPSWNMNEHGDTSHTGDKSGTATTKTATRQNGDICGQKGDSAFKSKRRQLLVKTVTVIFISQNGDSH